MDIKMDKTCQDMLLKLRERLAESGDVSEEEIAKNVTEVMILQSNLTEFFCNTHDASIKLLTEGISQCLRDKRTSEKDIRRMIIPLIENTELSAFYNILRNHRENMRLEDQRDNGRYNLICELCTVFEKNVRMAEVNAGREHD